MEKELQIIKKWGQIYVALILLGAFVEIIIGLGFNTFMLWIGMITVTLDSFYAFILYIVNAKLKSQHIIIEQNKEIIKLLSK